MLAVVGLHGCFEGSERAVYLFVYGYIDFRGGSPDNDDAVAAVLGLELANVLAQGFNHIPARGAIFHVVAVETLGIVAVESGLHGLNGFQLVFNGENVFGFEHFGVHGAFKGVGGIYVPRTEHDVFQICERHDFAVVQIFLVFTAAHADFVVLRH